MFQLFSSLRLVNRKWLIIRTIRAFLLKPIVMGSSWGLLNVDYCLSLNKLNKAKQSRTEISKLSIKVTRNSIIKIIVSKRFRTFHVRTSLNSNSSLTLRLFIWVDIKMPSDWLSWWFQVKIYQFIPSFEQWRFSVETCLKV